MNKYFFNKSLELFKNYKIQNKKILLAVSGGLDSIVLLDLLKKLSAPCKLDMSVVYIHHGLSKKKKIQKYRNQALQFVKKLCQSYKFPFLSPDPPKTILKSEDDFRNFRQLQLKKIQKEKQAHIIVLAHNNNDLLETKLIQLIRGCGNEGLNSMKIWNEPLLRPLLFFTRQEIHNYATQNKLQWLEDPSNKDKKYLRNWIRNQWLPDLEKKRTGSIKSLSRSLESLDSPQKEPSCFSAISSKGIKRSLLIEMPLEEQKRVLAFYMRQLNLSNYGQSHIKEILKQAERLEKEFSTKILKKNWVFTQNYIVAK